MTTVDTQGLQLAEIDGVRVLFHDLPGPMEAQLHFGVGQAHETLPIRGITHLLEHVVLSGSAQTPHAYNGLTGSVMTSFVAAGEAAQVTSHLAQVCANLAAPGYDRLEHERQVLKVEAAQRARGIADQLDAWRWGPVGFGLTGYDELGARWVGAPQLDAWATRFTRENAVLCLTQPPPASLRLPLRSGTGRLPVPDLTNPGFPTPGSFRLSGTAVALTFVGRRHPAAASALWLLQQRLEQRLRHELGVAYSVAAASSPLDAEHRQHVLGLEFLPEHSEVAQRHACEVLQGLGGEPTPEEWERLVSQRALGMQTPADVQARQELSSAAESLLQGRQPIDLRHWAELTLNATPTEVSDYLTSLLPTLVLGVPDPSSVPTALATPMPVHSRAVVQGRRFRASNAHPDPLPQSVVLSTEGASWQLDAGEPMTVTTAQLAGVLCYDDGARDYLGRDGFHVWVAPEHWRGVESALAELDAVIPPELRIPMGSRPKSAPRAPDTSQLSGPMQATLWTLGTLSALAMLVMVLAERAPVGALLPVSFLVLVVFRFRTWLQRRRTQQHNRQLAGG